jgi:hypothetical protein
MRLREALALGSLVALGALAAASCVGEEPESGPGGGDGASSAETGSADEASTPPGDAGSDAPIGDSGCGPGKELCGDAGCVELATSPEHCGACGKGCGVGKCTAGACPALIVFATANTWDGNLGGVSGADAKCQQAAVAAGFHGQYKAWLSLGLNSAKTRLSGAAKPYQLPNGVVVADTWGAFMSDTHKAPINRTETKTDLPATQFAWTQTKTNGDAYPPADDPCAGFTTGSTTAHKHRPGRVFAVDATWTEPPGFQAMQACSVKDHLYCIEQP